MARKFLSGVDLSNQKAVNVADPSAATDAANKQYVDNVARGLVIKDAVRAASTATINLAAPGATIDGVNMAANDRFLAKDQATGAQKGIYVWTGAATPATRALDADDGAELRPGTTLFVREGTVNADRQFVITSDAVITIGTSDMTWTQFGGGTTYTGSNGVQLVGQDFRGVVVASGGLTVGASGFAVDFAIVGRHVEGNLGNGALTTIDVTHNFGTKDVHVTTRITATDEPIEIDWIPLDVNTVRFTFPSAPSAAQYRHKITA